jgi:hypothetical protein
MVRFLRIYMGSRALRVVQVGINPIHFTLKINVFETPRGNLTAAGSVTRARFFEPRTTQWCAGSDAISCPTTMMSAKTFDSEI